MGYSTARICHYTLGHLPSDGRVAGFFPFTTQAVGTPGPVDTPGFRASKGKAPADRKPITAAEWLPHGPRVTVVTQCPGLGVLPPRNTLGLQLGPSFPSKRQTMALLSCLSLWPTREATL